MTAGRRIAGHERARDRDAEDRRFDVRAEPKRALEPAEVPVGLGRRADRIRHERAVHPDGIDLDEAGEACQHRGGEEQEAERPERLAGPEVTADDVVLGRPPARELGVLLEPQDEQVERR